VAIVLENGRGTRVELDPLGAAIASVSLHSGGTSVEISVPAGGSAGRTIGRYANRIAAGRFTLDGVVYELAKNEGDNTLHGGPDGFSHREWTLTTAPDNRTAAFALHSPDGDQGFPGALDCTIAYRLSDRDELWLDYTAVSAAPTVINLTNHVYFNLRGNGSGSIADQQLRIAASAYTPVDAHLIPTGDVASVGGTPLDYRTMHAIGDASIDTNFVLDGWNGELHCVAQVFDALSGRGLGVHTTQPGLQLYTGKPGAFALETQHFADAPNHPNFPSTVLRPGETFRSTTVYSFTF
jgi:aldose 1-epimerase